jgi:predicted HAD superfamily phosphohydrolase YqeG
MQKNEYDAAEVVEIGPAQAIVRGEKTIVPDLDSTLVEPIDQHYQE